MIVCILVIDCHVIEEWLHVLIEKLLHYAIVKVCVNEHRTDVGFDYVG